MKRIISFLICAAILGCPGNALCSSAFAADNSQVYSSLTEEIAAAWEGSDESSGTWSNGGWTTAQCAYNAETATEAIKFPSSTNPSAFLALSKPIAEAGKVDKMIVRIKSNQDVDFKLYYVTGTALKGFTETNSSAVGAVKIQKGDGDFKEYEFQVNENTFKGFTGAMQAFRFTVSQAATAAKVDFNAGLEVEIAYIRFVISNDTETDPPGPDEPSDKWPEVPAEEAGFEGRRIVYAVEMNDASSFNNWGQGLSYPPNIVNGIAEFKITDTANMSYSRNISVPTEQVERIAVRIRTTSSITPKLYFMGNGQSATEAQVFSFPTVRPSDEFRTIFVDTTSNEAWLAIGNVTSYRISFSGASSGDTVEVDFIRVYGAEVPPYTEDTRCILYDFEGSNYGFAGSEGVSDAVVYNGELWAKVSDVEASLTAENIDYSAAAEDIPRIDISYINNTPGTEGKLYFTTDENTDFNEDCSFAFSVSPNADAKCTIDTAENEFWKGKITGLRFVPSDAEGYVRIDSVRLEKFPCSISSRSGVVSVNGSLYGAKNKTVSVTVRDTQSASTVYSGQATSDKNGTFTFSFAIPNAPSAPTYYDMLFQSGEFDGTYRKRFVYISQQYEEDILAEINEAKTSADTTRLQSLIKNSYDILHLQSALYDDFAAAGLYMEEFYNNFAATGDIDNISDLENRLDEAVVMTQINHMTADEWVKAIDVYDSYLNFKSLPEYQTYSKADGDVKKAIAGKIGRHTDFSSARKAFQEQVVLESLRGAIAWGNVKDVLQTSWELLGIDFTAAENLKDPSGAYCLLSERNFNSIEEVKKAFNDAVETQKNKEKTTVSTGGGGGGGGGGSRDFQFSPTTVSSSPVVIPPDTTQVNKQNPFTDLSLYGWANDAVSALYEKNIISGNGNGLFEPSREVTREEYVKMLCMTFGLQTSDDNVSSFADVAEDAWYAPFIGAAVGAGFVSGQGENFGIGQPLTRQDAAAMAVRILAPEDAELKTDFSDYGEIADYAKDAVGFLTKAGIINGYEDGTFRPTEFLTRAEAAVILNNILSRKG